MTLPVSTLPDVLNRAGNHDITMDDQESCQRIGGQILRRFGSTPQMASDEAMSSPSPDVDDKLDSLLSRIQSLSGGGSRGKQSSDRPEPRLSETSAANHPSNANAAAGYPGTRTADSRPMPPMSAGGTGQPPARPPQPAKPADSSANASSSADSERPASLATPMGFETTRDEVWRPAEADDSRAAGIKDSLIEAIIYRYLQNTGESEGRAIADQLKIPFRMVEPVLERMKMEQNIAYKSATATGDYVYILTETGRILARNHIADCTYYGACPVTLEQYIASVKLQSIEGQYPKKVDLQRAFKDLLINPKMLRKLGPAVASGRGMFLFGFPGNGKTSIAERVTNAFGKYIWIPRAVSIDGEIMRVFDPMCHELAMPESSGGLLDVGGFDKRWVRIERPTIIAGGELTMEMLEVQNNSDSNISESPLQLKSNCGTLVIDDFGRQKMRVDELLNRWIVPLEKRYDFLNMASGKKIQVPFDQLVVFSTNLEPKDLVDDAFLRRIPYKIEAENPPEEDFRKLFEIMCRVVKIPFKEPAISYLIEKHYKPVNRPMRMCQPRDLLLQVKNYCLYNDLPVELKKEYLDFACENYFSVM